MLQKEANAGRIAPVKLFSGVSILYSLYADDTALFLQLDQQSFRTVTQVLELYCHATGAKVNFQKSELLPIGRHQLPPAWASTFGWKILYPSESTRYLGFQFSSTHNRSWTDIIRKLQNRVRYLYDNTLSFESRFLLMRHELSAVPNYLLPCLALTPGAANTLPQTYVDLLWGGNQDLQPKKHLVFSPRFRLKETLWIWRMVVAAFFTGDRARQMKLPQSHCEICSAPVETIHHLFLQCPCWQRLWQLISHAVLSLQAISADSPFNILQQFRSDPEHHMATVLLVYIWCYIWTL
ncbi:hypothetical protein R1sor_011664 [Riccia sorocarpa]|uniref:Reverse transcriptase zinc-binding domain-containing protein n=1 Tax=Riccia sorocarpa TaxID=122646 RepID=A0ABD3I1I6_9MARC